MFTKPLYFAAGLLAASMSTALRAEDASQATQGSMAVVLVASADLSTVPPAQSHQTSSAVSGVSAKRLNDVAARGPDALRRFIYMTQAIYAHDMQRHLASDDAR